MDRIEIARQIAFKLHTQAVAEGDDPQQPYAFVLAETKRRKIDVEGTAPSAKILDGGRAKYTPEDALILHENVGTPFEQAFLVAHEIGHAELGDGPEPARNIDPTRSSEPSPVGIDRVVDYSPRQRREVQMDLFAREFLLPRPVVRQLHVEEGLTAAQIAERFGAPFEVVAQQLLDSLLLPSVILPLETTRVEYPLNDLQASAAKYRGKAYLLEAGPGTGKTQTLTARVESLLNGGVDPRRILLLTFSNKAAGEMARRIALKEKNAAAAMWIGTFHAFGLDVIRRFHIELGLPKNPRLLDRTDAVDLLEQEFPRLNLAHYRNLYDPTQIVDDILKAISRAKDEVVEAQKYSELASTMLQKATTLDEKKTAEKAIEVAQVYQAYEQLKQQLGYIDFGDLVSLPVLLLESNPKIRNHFEGKYDHVLVDEYQDVNRSSVRLLQSLCGDGENLWVVGDAKQSIYRFRGASSFNIARFGKEDFPGGERGRLKQNYRSVEEVVKIYSKFSEDMVAGDRDSGLEAQRGSNGFKPELFTVDTAQNQTVALADNIEEMLSQGHNYRDQAVLCTGNEKLSNLAQDLERLRVPVLFLGSLFERPEIKDVLSLLSLLTDRRAKGLVRIACWPEFDISIADVSKVIDHLRDNEIAAEWRLGELATIPNLSEAGRTSLTKIGRVLDNFDESSSPWMVLATVLLDRTQMAAQIAVSDDNSDRSRGIALWQLMNFVRTQPSGQGLPITRLLDRIRRLVRLSDDRDLRQLPYAAQSLDAVRLMTIHGAKGLEFPVVHVPGLNVNTLPRTPQQPHCQPPDGMIEGVFGATQEVFSTEQKAEQECLFYVALSRARDRLFFYAPTKKNNGHQWGLSPFLDRLNGLNKRNGTPDRVLPDPQEDKDIEIVIDGTLKFSASQISQYDSCPRRFFYTQVLQIGGRRKETALMKMHEVVRTITQELIADSLAMDTNDFNLEKRICEATIAHELTDCGYTEELKHLATELIQYFVEKRVGYTPESPTNLKLTLDSGEIIVHVDDVLVDRDGKRVFRRIQTGRMRSTEDKDVGTAAFQLAVQQAFPDATVEFLHLSDKKSHSVSLSRTELQNRRNKLGGFLNNIQLGHFPTAPSTRTCSGCPAFFVCGPTPAGVLSKIF
jgi:superfamily I DNA/RNA helicase